jgi:alkanesulfonate monooxygenase
LLSGERVDLDGQHVQLHLDPPRITREARRCPPLYFGGLSDDAREVAAQAADVYLMWPDTVAAIGSLVDDMRARAARYGRTLRFGLRVHVIVRDTDAEARAAASHLMAAVDDATGASIRARSLDSASVGVRRQAELRDAADLDGFVEPHLWTGIGRARSGCGAAIVGDPDQVLATLARYRQVGIDAFILSGYPHLDECDRFASLVLPHLEHAPLVS